MVMVTRYILETCAGMQSAFVENRKIVEVPPQIFLSKSPSYSDPSEVKLLGKLIIKVQQSVQKIL